MNQQIALGKHVFTRNDALLTILTLGICILFAGNSIAGLIWRNAIYPASDLYNSFLPNDFINLFFGVPILVISILLARNNNRLGLIGWAGSLLFVLYNDIAYLFAVRQTYSLIVNAVIIALCITVLALMMTSLDSLHLVFAAPPIHRPRVYGVVLIGMGLAFMARALMNIINVVTGNAILPPPEIAVNIADAVVCPLWIISGIFLFTKTKAGYIAGFISYFHGSMLFIALMIFLVIQPILCHTEFIIVDLLVIAIMSLVFLIPCILLARLFSTYWSKPD